MQLVNGLRLLGVAPDEFEAILAAETDEAAAEALQDLKTQTRTRWRSSARKLHPDQGGNAADFALAKDVSDFIAGLQLTELA